MIICMKLENASYVQQGNLDVKQHQKEKHVLLNVAESTYMNIEKNSMTHTMN